MYKLKVKILVGVWNGTIGILEDCVWDNVYNVRVYPDLRLVLKEEEFEILW